MIRLPAPLSKLKFSRMSGDDLKHYDRIFESFPINAVNLLIPSLRDHKEKFEDILVSDESTYFIVKDVTVTCLLQHTFLEYFVRKGLLLSVSHNAEFEVDNFLSIIPPGKLILSLEKNIAECLALQKEKSYKNKKKDEVFQNIIINLASTELYPGKKLYQSIFTELSKIDHIKFTLLMKWKPDGNVCAQSLKSYFVSEGFECKASMPKHKYSFKFSVIMPKLRYDILDADAIKSIFEWIGMQICEIEYVTGEQSFAHTLTIPEPSEILYRLQMCSFEGFYSKSDVLPVINEMSKLFETDSSLPFIVMHLSGYQDSYIEANGFEHFSSEDKLICLVIFPSSKHWIITLNAR